VKAGFAVFGCGFYDLTAQATTTMAKMADEAERARWLRDLESEETTKARESGATWAEIGASQDRPRQTVHRQASKTPHRPRVEGLTLAEYRHVGTSDLRYWLEWWSEPERSPEGREEKGRDPEEEKRKLRAEIEARERLGVAGPDRDRVW